MAMAHASMISPAVPSGRTFARKKACSCIGAPFKSTMPALICEPPMSMPITCISVAFISVIKLIFIVPKPFFCRRVSFYRRKGGCPPFLVRFITHPQFQKPSFGKGLMGKPEIIQWLPIQPRLLDITVGTGIGVCPDHKFIPFIITIIQLDGNLIEDGRSDLIHRGDGFIPRDVEQSDRHQRAYTAHLSLVFVMAAISEIRCSTAVRLSPYSTYPVLGKPGLTGIAEYMSIGAARLICIANIPVIVSKNKIAGGSLLKGIIQLVTEGIIATHQLR